MATIYGEYNADGSIKTNPDTCAVTGLYVDKHNSVRERVPGTDVFYRIRQSVYEDVTDEQRQSIRAQSPQHATQAAVKQADAAPETEAVVEPPGAPAIVKTEVPQKGRK